MKLGLGSYACAWEIGVPGSPPPEPLDVHAFLERAAALGFRLIQIADNLPLHVLTAAELAGLRRRADDLGIEMEVGTRGISIEHLEKYIRICNVLGSRLLRVVVDTADHHPNPREVVELIRRSVPRLTSAGVVLAVENHDRFPSAALAGIVREIESPNVGICLDTVNSFGSLEGPEVVVRTLGEFVVNLHVKDFQISRASHMMGFTIEGTPAGEGSLDMPWLLEQLRQAGRRFNCILELWPPPECNIADTVAKERRWVEISLANLRQLIAD